MFAIPEFVKAQRVEVLGKFQVALNDMVMVFAFAPIVGLLLGLSAIVVPWGTLVLSVMLRPGMLRQALGISAWAPDGPGPALEQLADPARLARLLAAMDAERPLAEYVELLQQFLLETLDWRSAAGFGAALLAVRQKIFLPVVEIASWFGLGERPDEILFGEILALGGTALGRRVHVR